MPIERNVFNMRDRFRREDCTPNPLTPRTVYEEHLPVVAPVELALGGDPTPNPKKPRAPKAATPPKALPVVKSESIEKERYTLNLPSDLVEQARNAAWGSRTPLNTIAEEGLRRELVRLEKANGGPFPQREGDLPAGRRLSR